MVYINTIILFICIIKYHKKSFSKNIRTDKIDRPFPKNIMSTKVRLKRNDSNIYTLYAHFHDK